MTKPDNDQSKQARWQQKQRKAGKCRQCGSRARKTLCARCGEENRIRARNRYRAKMGIPLDAPLYKRVGK